MKTHVALSLLAAALVAGAAFDAAVRRSDRATFCAAPLVSNTSARPVLEPAPKAVAATPAPKKPAKP